MGYWLFFLVTAMIFVRPAEIFPSIEALPIYYYLTLACFALSLPSVLRQVGGRPLTEQPMTACVLGLLAAVVFSHLSHLNLYDARVQGFAYFKVVLFYLLLVSLLDSPVRIRQYLIGLVVFTVVLTALALLHFHGLVNLPSLEALQRRDYDEESGEESYFRQLMSTGIFNDPNDLSLILVAAIVATLYLLGNRQFGLLRTLWVAPLALFGHALEKTHSRGGFIALLTALMVFIYSRFGRAKSILIFLILLPVMFVLFAGRSTNISTNDETAQTRIEMWAEGLLLLRQSPLFGIGKGRYADEAGQVAHNSFLHCFTELGLFGGTLFLGAFCVAILSLRPPKLQQKLLVDPEMNRLRPYLLGIVAGYAAGLMSLSRSYVEPTYMILGMVAAYGRTVATDPDLHSVPKFNLSLIRLFIIYSILFLIFMQIVTRIFLSR